MIRTLLLSLLCLTAGPACTATPPTTGFNPAQLRDFPRDTLTVQRSEGRDLFQIWVAETSAQQQQGLMWIQQLPRDYGMLFLLPEPRPMDMWMKNTYVPLDMLFFDTSGRIIHIHERAVPQSEAIISSGAEVAGVVEILAGEAKRRGIEVGDQILSQRLAR
jgi:uncharacterized membrane protein (UPF0127 family)